MAATFAGLGFGNAGVHIPHANAYPIAGRVRDYRPEGYPRRRADRAARHGGLADRARGVPVHLRGRARAPPPRRAAARPRLPRPTDRTRCRACCSALMRDIGLPNGLAEVGYGDADVDDLVDGLAPAAAAAGDRAARRDRRGPGRRVPRVDGALVTGRPRTWSPSCVAAGVTDVDDSVLARALVLLRRLALPGRCRRSSSARGTPTSCSPSSTSRATARGAADHARRRYVDRRQRGRPGHRGRHRPPPEPGRVASTPRRAPPWCSPASCTRPCSGRPRRTGCGSGPTRRRTPAAPIGGMIGNNACGSRALGYGRTADNVAGLRVAFGTAAIVDAGAGLGRSTALVALVAGRRAPRARAPDVRAVLAGR